MSDTPQYPTRCVSCDNQKGYPFQVRTLGDKPGHIEIRLRCRDCGHEWIEIVAKKE